VRYMPVSQSIVISLLGYQIGSTHSVYSDGAVRLNEYESTNKAQGL
jgi:hypothetical protein